MTSTKDWGHNSHKIEFGITNYCNAKCPLCTHTHMHETGTLKLQHADFSVFENVVNQFTNHRIIVLCGDYGDPMMHPQIQDYIDYGTSNGHTIIIHTNGGLRTTKFYEHNAKNKNLELVFGIDGTSQESNQKYRVNVDYNKAMSNMLCFAKNGGKTQWDYLLFTYNIDEMSKAIEICKQNKIKFMPTINNRPWEYRIEDPNVINQLINIIKEYKRDRHIFEMQNIKKYKR